MAMLIGVAMSGLAGLPRAQHLFCVIHLSFKMYSHCNLVNVH